MRVCLALFPLLVACGTAPPPTTGTTTDTTTPSNPTEPTTTNRPQSGEIGSLVLRRLATQASLPPRVELAGVFPKSDTGYTNLASCARLLQGTPCLPQLPDTEDDFLDIDPDRAFDFSQFDYGYVGPSIGLGPLNAVYTNAGNGLPHYYNDLTEEYGLSGFDGTWGVRIGGEWGDYQGWDDITIAPMMNLMSHEAGLSMPVHDGQTVVLEWEPEPTGDVYLTVQGGGIARMYLLEDDGYFELDIDDLGLGTSEEDLEFALSRWERSEVDVNGNTLELLSISEVTWPGNYFYVGGRDVLITADTCGDTDTQLPVTTGQYWGRIQDWGYVNNMNPGYGGCTGFNSSGADGFVRFDLPPLTYLSVAYTLLTDDASLYLVTDCTQSNTCLVGSDMTLLGQEESVQYLNSTDEEQTVYAVLDGWRDTTGLFYADIAVNTLGPPDMYDSCSAVQSQPGSLTSGGYYSSVTAYTNQLDPATGGCLPVSSPGPDAMTKVTLQNGQTLTVNLDMPGSNPALYLLSSCTTTTACKAGIDASVGARETLIYQNTSGSTENLYLVVDTKVAMSPYFMIVDIL